MASRAMIEGVNPAESFANDAETALKNFQDEVDKD
jgi:hypothetical protein